MEMQRRLAAPAARAAGVVRAVTDPGGTVVPEAQDLAATAAPSPSPITPPLRRSAPRLMACLCKREAGAAPAVPAGRAGDLVAASAGLVGRVAEQEIRARASPY